MDQCSSWVSLGFLRAIAASEAMCKLLSSSAWVNMLLRMVEAKGHVQNSDERGNVDLVSYIFSIYRVCNFYCDQYFVATISICIAEIA